MDSYRFNTGGNAPKTQTTMRRMLPPTTTVRTPSRIVSTTTTSTRRMLPTTTAKTSSRIVSPPAIRPTPRPVYVIGRPTPKPTQGKTPAPPIKTSEPTKAPNPKPTPTKAPITTKSPVTQPPVAKYGVPGPTKQPIVTKPPVVKYGVPGPTQPPVVVKYGVPGPTLQPIAKYGVPGPTLQPIVKYGVPGPTYNLDKIYAGIKGLDVSIISTAISETVTSNKNSIIKAGNDSLGLLLSKSVSSASDMLDGVKVVNNSLNDLNQNKLKPALKKVEELQVTLEERAKIINQIKEYESKYNKQRDEITSYLRINPDGGNVTDRKVSTNGNAAAQVELKKAENQLYELKTKLKKLEDKAYEEINYVKKIDGSIGGAVDPGLPATPPVPPSVPFTPPGDIYYQPEYGVPYTPPGDIYYQPEYGVPYTPPGDIYYQPEYGVPYTPPGDVYYQPEYGVPYVTTKYGVKCADPEGKSN